MNHLSQTVSITPIIKEIPKRLALAITSIFISHSKIFTSADLYWLRSINKTLMFSHLRGVYALLFLMIDIWPLQGVGCCFLPLDHRFSSQKGAIL